ncbi:MAG TPA: MupA/Atu3671 family FMN-dependent luciferase-like monooxygenase [Ramlibacter sp.]|nr:MupA/Atu3671 family FMN-dependent luciferase-like monooxygenase [Ramlibacter sp.]
MSVPVRAAFVGDGTLMVRCIEAYRSAGHQVTMVASADTAILEWALAQELPTERFDAELRLDGVEFDYLFSVANLKVLPQKIIELARVLALNFHDGPLPLYAGLNAPAWALMAGERRHGVTWHEMTAQVDRGRIARQALFDLAPDETAFSLNARCYEAGFQAFCGVLEDIARGGLALAQQQGEATMFARDRRPELLATLDWTRSAAQLEALARGLDFGNYANPLALPKLWLGERLMAVKSLRAQPLPGAGDIRPGTVLEASGDSLRVATADGAVTLEGLRPLDAFGASHGLKVGDVLPAISPETRERLASQLPRLAKAEAHWRRALRELVAAPLPYPRRNASADNGGAGMASGASASAEYALKARAAGAQTVAAFGAWLCASSGQNATSMMYADAALADQACGIEPWASACVPLTLAAEPRWLTSQACARAESRIAQLRQAGPMSRDLPLRGEGAATLPDVGIALGAASLPAAVVFALQESGGALSLRVDTRVFDAAVAQLMVDHLDAYLQAFARADAPLAEVPLAPPHEAALLEAINDTHAPFDAAGGVPACIAQVARQNPASEALRCHDDSVTYAQLQERATRLAQALRERGVQSGDIVGLCLDRSSELVVAVLAIHKAGAAYLPLDPDYPAERLRFMFSDSGAQRVVCSEATAALLSLAPEQAVPHDAQPGDAAAADAQALPQVSGDDAAYVIYTSGSTGKPKGVVVTHANVLNFFAGMDRRVPHEDGGRWLAVTSLSFDISVLELLWTLARGFTVVVHSNAPVAAAAAAPAIDFSLFYFASDESAQGGDRYRLLMDGARFADEHGFSAVWTPERHFHAFGGLYPNPAVASAAVAAITRRVKIRAGSCVSPLHHAVRIAEDWSLVDNISHGRVGVSFATGWQPNDFVLAPQAFANRKQLMFDQIDMVRALWRGDAVPFPGHDGKPVQVRTLPRPVQAQLPIWLTAAGNPETFIQAGEKGANLLTHLLGQTVEDVAGKIALYRKAWRDAGHPGQPQVTMMMHTFIGADEAAVRETAREPMKAYLRSSVDLIRAAAWSFPTFVQRGAAAGQTPLQIMEAQPLTEAEMDALLDHAFARYANTSALIGTPESCLPIVQKLQDAGVDEVACLIDFGIPTDAALEHLQDLRSLMQLAQRPRRAAGAGTVSVAAQIERHGITHLQCTPSMATMLVADSAGRAALAQLSALLVGGEALPLPLARELRGNLKGKLLNMYGPTETTVWSTCCELSEIGDFVPLGEPIANTTLHIRNAWGQECPALAPGELLIGGAGVTRGYLGRAELTAERFIDDAARPGERLYRTGDLVRRRPDGQLEFLGRIDHQVKIRGHRVELGEIENVLARQAGVRDAVVLARHDSAGEAFLLGYVTGRPGEPAPDPEALRQGLARELPEIMTPKSISVRSAFPLTPNGKIDRNALGQSAPAPAARAAAAPSAGLEQIIAAIWSEVLGLPEVERDSNFFDLGGHSLLVIQVQRRLREATGREVSVTDMFRLPTISAIAQHLQQEGGAPERAVNEGQSRAQMRRALRARSGAAPVDAA